MVVRSLRLLIFDDFNFPFLGLEMAWEFMFSMMTMGLLQFTTAQYNGWRYFRYYIHFRALLGILRSFVKWSWWRDSVPAVILVVNKKWMQPNTSKKSFWAYFVMIKAANLLLLLLHLWNAKQFCAWSIPESFGERWARRRGQYKAWSSECPF